MRMRSRAQLTSVLTAVAFFLSVPVSLGQEPDPRSTIEGTLEALIEHLRARRFDTVVREFTTPESLKELQKRATLEQIVASGIAKGDFDRLLTACERVSNVKPQLSPEGALAVFEYVDKEGKQSTFGLRRVENRWYVM